MGWTVQVVVALLNIVWIIFFLTPEPFSVFVQRRSTNEEDQYSEFCIELPPVKIPSNKTNNTKTTSQGIPPEQEPTTPGIPPEQEATTPGIPPEQEAKTPGSPPEHYFFSDRLGPDNCCPNHYLRRLDKRLVRSYIMTDRRCPKTAVILLTKRSGRICADPNRSWVKSIMGMVDKRTF
nr:chemokine (C-C motif) ligand 36 [Sebastes schlegelii]